MDADGSGKLDLSELKSVFSVVKERAPVSDRMIEAMFKAMSNAEGLVDYKELMGSFRVRRTETSKTLPAALSNLSLRESTGGAAAAAAASLAAAASTK